MSSLILEIFNSYISTRVRPQQKKKKTLSWQKLREKVKQTNQGTFSLWRWNLINKRVQVVIFSSFFVFTFREVVCLACLVVRMFEAAFLLYFSYFILKSCLIYHYCIMTTFLVFFFVFISSVRCCLDSLSSIEWLDKTISFIRISPL